jgi:hypothetical protein
MSDVKELTLAEVATHTTKKDLYMVIHDKVYDCSSFVDEHPYVPPIHLALPKYLMIYAKGLRRVSYPVASPCPYRKVYWPAWPQASLPTQSHAIPDH